MKLTTRASYGLRAALALAAAGREKPLTTAALAKGNGIPKSYLEQILNKLRRHGIVEAARGAKGGYRLARGPETISVGDIVRALEGAYEPMLCPFPEAQSSECRREEGCLGRPLCVKMELSLTCNLDNTILSDMLNSRHPDADPSPSEQAEGG